MYVTYKKIEEIQNARSEPYSDSQSFLPDKIT